MLLWSSEIICWVIPKIAWVIRESSVFWEDGGSKSATFGRNLADLLGETYIMWWPPAFKILVQMSRDNFSGKPWLAYEGGDPQYIMTPLPLPIKTWKYPARASFWLNLSVFLKRLLPRRRGDAHYVVTPSRLPNLLKTPVNCGPSQKCGTKGAACEVACSPHLFHFFWGETEEPKISFALT